MPAAYDERAPSRGRSKNLINNSSSVNRNEIPPPHLHSSQLYLQGNESLPGGAHSEDHFNHFVSEHEIKFTRNDLCTPSTCICFFIAFLFSSFALMSGIYYGRKYYCLFLFVNLHFANSGERMPRSSPITFTAKLICPLICI